MINRDHSTVIHSIRTVENDLKLSEEIDEIIFQSKLGVQKVMGILPNHAQDIARIPGKSTILES